MKRTSSDARHGWRAAGDNVNAHHSPGACSPGPLMWTRRPAARSLPTAKPIARRDTLRRAAPPRALRHRSGRSAAVTLGMAKSRSIAAISPSTLPADGPSIQLLLTQQRQGRRGTGERDQRAVRCAVNGEDLILQERPDRDRPVVGDSVEHVATRPSAISTAREVISSREPARSGARSVRRTGRWRATRTARSGPVQRVRRTHSTPAIRSSRRPCAASVTSIAVCCCRPRISIGPTGQPQPAGRERQPRRTSGGTAGRRVPCATARRASRCPGVRDTPSSSCGRADGAQPARRPKRPEAEPASRTEPTLGGAAASQGAAAS